MNITQADRDVEEQLVDCYFVRDCEDPDHDRALELLAAHREAAFLAGVKAGLEAAWFPAPPPAGDA